ncbi:MAG: IucA/IucC family protein [Nocardioidaceae bacterium]
MTIAPVSAIDPRSVVAHLEPAAMRRAHRDLVRKALAELAHERIIRPVVVGPGSYLVSSDDGAVTYTFDARQLALGHWLIDAASVERRLAGRSAPLDALDLVLELRESLGIGEPQLAVYLEEISSTLFGAAYKLGRDVPGTKDLVRADFQTVEAAMSEGHPCFVANNGRIGFDAADYRAYAPETGAAYRIVWLAVHASRATTAVARDGDYDEHVRRELGDATVDGFAGHLAGLGLDIADYRLMPIHPWQWTNKLAMTFATDVGRRDIVCLGHAPDSYTAQQSIRTSFNRDRPDRCYVKTSLSILNMGFMRGLSPGYMSATPAINDWVRDLIAADSYLASTGFSIIAEVAAVGYHSPHYDRLPAGSAYQKMLSALWRESPVPTLRGGQRLATMAALLHVDADGDSYARALIESSGLEPASWVRRYLDAYLAPLLHCFYAYGLVFMPHGENVIMVLENGVPVRMIMKDIGEEVAVMDPSLDLPAEVRRVQVDVPHELRLLSLFTDVFDCFFRFLSALLDEHDVLPEDAFWRTVHDCVTDYQNGRPELADAFAAYDIFTPDFALSCLNRLQLRNNEQMVDLSDPAGALQVVGTLRNPISPPRTENTDSPASSRDE